MSPSIGKNRNDLVIYHTQTGGHIAQRAATIVGACGCIAVSGAKLGRAIRLRRSQLIAVGNHGGMEGLPSRRCGSRGGEAATAFARNDLGRVQARGGSPIPPNRRTGLRRRLLSRGLGLDVGFDRRLVQSKTHLSSCFGVSDGADR